MFSTLPLQDPSKAEHAGILRAHSIAAGAEGGVSATAAAAAAAAAARAGGNGVASGGAASYQGRRTAPAAAIQTPPGPPRVVDLTVVRAEGGLLEVGESFCRFSADVSLEWGILPANGSPPTFPLFRPQDPLEPIRVNGKRLQRDEFAVSSCQWGEVRCEEAK